MSILNAAKIYLKHQSMILLSVILAIRYKIPVVRRSVDTVNGNESIMTLESPSRDTCDRL